MANSIKLEDYQEMRQILKQLLVDKDELKAIFDRIENTQSQLHGSDWISKGSAQSQESYNNLRSNYDAFCALIEKASKEISNSVTSVEEQDAAADKAASTVTDGAKVIKVD